MTRRMFIGAFLVWACTTFVVAQQVGDEDFRPAVSRPAYEEGEGPSVLVDEAHNNFHTVNGRYKPFAELLRRDGYRVSGLDKPLSASSLQSVAVLVIANPLHKRNVKNWSLPTSTAFSKDEIDALHAWVKDGGSLFLIADHMPFPGAVGALAKAFGVEFSNGFAAFGHHEQGKPDSFGLQTGLMESVITRGRTEDEKVTEIVTFTGSAFKAEQHATPILVFAAGSTSREPKQAWQFDTSTPKIPIEGWCQCAVMQVGRGRVAISGEAAMFTAQVAGPEKIRMGMNSPHAKQNAQLLLNLMHWLSRVPGMREQSEQGASPDADKQRR